MKPGAEIRQAEGQSALFISGDWTSAHIEALGRLGAELAGKPGLALVRGLDLSELGLLDTAGAFLIDKLRRGLLLPAQASAPALLPLAGGSADKLALLELVAQSGASQAAPFAAGAPSPGAFKGALRVSARPLHNLGEAVHGLGRAALERLSFFGAFMAALGRNIAHPSEFRLTSLVYHMEQAGVRAVPIVALLAFLIGTVLAYMAAGQLANFGAEIFVVKLLEVGVMREMGVLITAILVAGRSGSSFTAQIGSMLANQEVDAMRSMGMDPMSFLVLPRMLALVIMLPALVLLADLAGMLGGLCAVWLSLDITPQIFIDTLQRGINFGNVVAGLVKAPFFALVIGGIGCLTGFKAGQSADSVGRMTTRAVVESIFLVITLDALFALFFSKIGF